MMIYSAEVFNLGTTAKFSNSPVPKGCLGVTVDSYRFDTFHELGRGIFFSDCGGLVNVYKHSPGTKDGFAGRRIVLPVVEPSVMFPRIKAVRRRVFDGSLWSSWEADLQVAKHLGTSLTSIGVRDLSGGYRSYCSALATTEFLNRLAKVVVLGEPQQSPLI